MLSIRNIARRNCDGQKYWNSFEKSSEAGSQHGMVSTIGDGPHIIFGVVRLQPDQSTENKKGP